MAGAVRSVRRALAWVNGTGLPGTELVDSVEVLADGIALCGMASAVCGFEVPCCEVVYSEADAVSNAEECYRACANRISEDVADPAFDVGEFMKNKVGVNHRNFGLGVQFAAVSSMESKRKRQAVDMIVRCLLLLQGIESGKVKEEATTFCLRRTNSKSKSPQAMHQNSLPPREAEGGPPKETEPDATVSAKAKIRPKRRSKAGCRSKKAQTRTSSPPRVAVSPPPPPPSHPPHLRGIPRRAKSKSPHRGCQQRAAARMRKPKRREEAKPETSLAMRPGWNSSTLASPPRRLRAARTAASRPQQATQSNEGRLHGRDRFQAGSMFDPSFKPSAPKLKLTSRETSPGKVARRRRRQRTHASPVQPPFQPTRRVLPSQFSAVFSWLRRRGYASNIDSRSPSVSARIVDLIKDGVLLCDLVMRLELDSPGTNRVDTVEIQIRGDGGDVHKLITLRGVAINPVARAARVKNLNIALEILRKRKKINARHLWSVDDIADGDEETTWELLSDICADYGGARARKVARPRKQTSYRESATSLVLKRGKSPSRNILGRGEHLGSPPRQRPVDTSRHLLSPPNRRSHPRRPKRSPAAVPDCSLLFTKEMERELAGQLSPILLPEMEAVVMDSNEDAMNADISAIHPVRLLDVAY